MKNYTFKHELNGDTITVAAPSLEFALDLLDQYLRDNTYWEIESEEAI